MAAAMLETRSEHACFSGIQGFYSHPSSSTGTIMNFSVFVPGAAKSRKVPALYYLAGLTCTDETFMVKAGAQKLADELGLMLIACDTSPRGLELPAEHDDWDFGSGAGFYLDATASPWNKHYRMGSYINAELPALIEENFPALAGTKGICGHSMGGHGALVSALRNPERWQSVSAFAPISNPVNVPWGQKAFSNYLAAESEWRAWDASCLMAEKAYPGEVLIDQGDGDQFLERELHPESLEGAARTSGQQLRLRRHSGFDHGYYFIQSFIDDHLRHHAAVLCK
ncbi:MAG TPA: S-formylglutathione hydrolase [Spongiibacteraceae bacterium]|nr:S-formylglutathione hydrolase [Spongiibacteraceae bacterium]MBN51628.1 S-formylglutathione hydrolase [Spongiibacteraceae bacterium]HCS28578.1 S-formylglutathione hydrolase [Spongiibacteraceae bacterium]|tara:strand:+ start:1454 stop:2302 length:849 start_codon:yes stop_codon:yes gene_type:complete